MSPAPRLADGALALGALGKGVVGAAAVALDDALEAFRHDFVQADGGASGAPVKDGGFRRRVVDHPQISDFGLPVAGSEILDGRLPA